MTVTANNFAIYLKDDILKFDKILFFVYPPKGNDRYKILDYKWNPQEQKMLKINNEKIDKLLKENCDFSVFIEDETVLIFLKLGKENYVVFLTELEIFKDDCKHVLEIV